MSIGPKRCILRGKLVGSLDRFYDEIARQLAFPDHFGRNLDALWDVLSTDVEGPVELIWEDAENSRTVMKQDWERLFEVLRKVESDRNDFRVTLR